MSDISVTLHHLERYEEAFDKQKEALEIYQSLQIDDAANKVTVEQRIIDSLDFIVVLSNKLGRNTIQIAKMTR